MPRVLLKREACAARVTSAASGCKNRIDFSSALDNVIALMYTPLFKNDQLSVAMHSLLSALKNSTGKKSKSARKIRDQDENGAPALFPRRLLSETPTRKAVNKHSRIPFHGGNNTVSTCLGSSYATHTRAQVCTELHTTCITVVTCSPRHSR